MRKQRTSKFVGKEFDNGWTCTNINVAHCTLTHKNGGPRYWYSFERPTKDGKFTKWIRVEAKEATKIYKGLLKVEDVAKKLEAQKQHYTNYQFAVRR